MRRVRTNCRHFAVAIAVSACVHNASYLQAQDKAAPQNPTKQTDQLDEAANGDHHSPELGVLVGSCPGEGVCVIDTLRGGPADRVGVEPGDYILAINDQTVTNPQDLKKKIESLDSDDTINLNLWRRGKYVNKEVRLAKESAKLPESHRGWLGVVLAPADDGAQGATIREVASDSPAEKAGLQRGDEIIKLNGNQVQTLEQFVNDVSDFEPGKEIKLAVRRDGSEQEITAELGQVIEAPVQWFRNRMPAQEGFPGFPMSGMSGMPGQSGPPVLDEMLNDMRRQIRVLRQEVDQLKAASPTAKEAEKTVPQDDDVSSHQTERSVSPRLATVDHIPSHASLRSRLFLAQAQPNISNDWSGARYTSPAYQGWRDNQRQSSNGNNGGFTYPYYNYGNGGYGYGYNGYNGYNNYNNYRYYQYGGRPYYYGGGYPYGYRGGVGFGTGLGVYW